MPVHETDNIQQSTSYTPNKLLPIPLQRKELPGITTGHLHYQGSWQVPDESQFPCNLSHQPGVLSDVGSIAFQEDLSQWCVLGYLSQFVLEYGKFSTQPYLQVKVTCPIPEGFEVCRKAMKVNLEFLWEVLLADCQAIRVGLTLINLVAAV